MERWKPIPGYEGKYEVSSIGNVKSLNYRRSGKERCLKMKTDRDGYLQLGLSKPGSKTQYFQVHRLVLMAFVGECPVGYHVAHLNGITDDNRLENLVCVTPKENSSHRLLHGTDFRGEKNVNAKLSEDEVKEIWARSLGGETNSDMAEEFGVLPSTICLIKQGRSWSWLTSTLPQAVSSE